MSAGARHGVVLARVAALSSSPRCLSHHLFSFEIQNELWTFNAFIYSLAIAFYGVEILNENKWKLTS